MRQLLLALLFLSPIAAAALADDDAPLRAMIITAGCCHDYPFQTSQLMKAAKERDLVVDWTIIHQGGSGTKAQIDLYENPNWAKGYDVVIHNECFANTTDPSYIRNITKAHKEGINAVVIHCAMHTYRAAKIDDWREMLGVTSKHHEHQSEYPVKVVAKDHPIMEGFPADYKTPKDELYIVKHVWPHTKVLATSTSEKTGEPQPVFWTNQYGKGRVFGTTYGHSNATFSDEVFLDTVVKGTLWAAGRLKDKKAASKQRHESALADFAQGNRDRNLKSTMRIRSKIFFLISFKLSLILAVVAHASRPLLAEESPVVPAVDSESAQSFHNEQDHRMQGVLWVQASLEHHVLCAQTYRLALTKLREGLTNPNWTACTEQGKNFSRKPPAVILDVDETVLDNSPFNARLIEDGTGYDPAKWGQWCSEAKARAIPGAKEFVHDAMRLGVQVFFVTNRDHKLKAYTATNLARSLGITVTSDRLLLKNERSEWTSGKYARRAHVAKTHRIVLIVGDDFNDFVWLGKKQPLERIQAGQHFASSFGHHWILLPNPIYGNWEKSIYNFDFDRTELEQIKIRHGLLRSERE